MNAKIRNLIGFWLILATGVFPGFGQEPEPPQPSEIGFVRLINLVAVGEGTTTILIDGVDNWPQGFKLGQRTGGLGLKRGEHEITLKKKGCKEANRSVTVAGGATQSLVAYAEAVRNDSGEIVEWELKIARLKQHTPEKGQFMTVVSFCEAPEIPLDIHETMTDKHLRPVAKRLGVVRVSLPDQKVVAIVSHREEYITTLATDSEGNYVVMLYDEATGNIGALKFFDPKFVLAEWSGTVVALSRRRFIKNSGGVIGGLGAASWSLGQEAPADARRTISILHTTDLHGHVLPTSTYDGTPDLGGLARCASQIRTWREENPYSILVDVGDVYQGTPVGWMTRGRLMIDLFNKLGYDAWVLGNHEFDWGPEVVVDALSRSNMPVMTANVRLDGTLAGDFEDQTHPLAKVKPYVIRVIGGFKIGLVGLITPGLPYWLPEELRKGFEAVDPVDILRAQVRELREENQVDAVVVCGHMGWRSRDDFANPVNELLRGEHGVDVFIGGHTHQNHSSREVRSVLYTQADYYGIHCGRVDLVFDLDTRKLVEKRARTVLMDQAIAADPLVLEASAKNLGEAQVYLDREIGELKGTLSAEQPSPGSGSPLQKLLGAAFAWHARQQEVEIDGVFHGTFGTGDLAAGPKTVADAWELIPYDNGLVVLQMTHAELVGIVNEALRAGSDRALFGFEVEVAENEAAKYESRGGRFVTSLRSLRRPEAGADARFSIICNSYDAQSGGKRLMRLRAIAERMGDKKVVLPLNSREALIEFFLARETVNHRDIEAAG